MRSLFAALALICLLPAAGHAACAGTDLSATLAPDDRAALAAALSDHPYPEGNHWRATRGAAEVHLVGTIHVGDARLDAPVARLADVVASADTLLLEMTRADRAALARAMAEDPALLLLPGASLPDRLPEADWQAIRTALEARGVPGFMGARMRPWYLSVLLSIPPCLDMAAGAETGVDARLEAAAEAAGVPVLALEDARGLFSAFDTVPFEAQMDMVRTALAAPDAAEDLFETLMASYLREEHGAAWALSELFAERFAPGQTTQTRDAFETMESLLLDRRNAAWIPVIVDAAEAADGPMVAAFGAAHLGGPTGVLALLEAEGFTLERRPF